MSELTISIDGQRHIRKLSERYLPERELVLLEWVRFARLRQANQITITITPEKTLVIDNGKAIDDAMWQAMETLIKSNDSEVIEHSIETLKPIRGIGMLAPLASGADSFAIFSRREGNWISIRHGHGDFDKSIALIDHPVALLLGPRQQSLSRELTFLRHHLPLVKAQITLNHQPIVAALQPSNTFLSLKLYQGEAIVGSVSLPKSNNHSTLEICHGDIPWRTLHFPSKEGRIFWARLESVLNEDELKPMQEQIEQANVKLLEFLCEYHDKWPRHIVHRIEELLFEWVRSMSPPYPIAHLPLFRSTGHKRDWTLEELLEKSQNSTLTAVISEKGVLQDGTTSLVLTRRQADFLHRSVGIPLQIVSAPVSVINPFTHQINRLLIRLLASLDRLGSRWLAKKRLQPQLTHQLALHLPNAPAWNSHPELLKYRIEVRDHRGLWPSHISRKEGRIVLHSRHLIVTSLLNALENNRDSGLLEMSLLPPELS